MKWLSFWNFYCNVINFVFFLLFLCDEKHSSRKNQPSLWWHWNAYGARWGWQLCFCRWEQPGWWPHSCSSSQCRCQRAQLAGSSVWSPSSCLEAPPDDGRRREDGFMKDLQHRWNTETVKKHILKVCLGECGLCFRLTVMLAAPSTGRPSLSHSIIEGGLAPRDTQLKL